MSELVKKLNNDINSNDYLICDDVKLIRVQYLKKSNKLRVIIKAPEKLNEKKLELIKSIIANKISCFASDSIELIYYKDICNVTIQEIATKYWIDVLENTKNIVPIAKESLKNASVIVEDNLINVNISNKFICKFLKNKGIEKLIKKIIGDIFSVSCNIKLNYDANLNVQKYFENKEKENEKIIEDVVKQVKLENKEKAKEKSKQNFSNQNTFNKNPYKSAPKNENTILGKTIIGDTINIKQIDQTSGVVIIEGDIFKVDIIETKSGRKIVTFYITDYTSSISVKVFPKQKDEESILEEIKKGVHCKVRGEATYDTYSKDVVIMCRDINKALKIETMDTAKEKRIELHLHTQMSAMDGMTSASKLIERAAKWGHKAIAITDHGVVQAYPEAMGAEKKYNIKVVYGIEAYLVDDGEPIVINESDETIKDTYVVFDIETTGLSFINDKIIEIGAVKVVNGEIVEKFSEFVNPKVNIPYKIVELTGITDEMVKDADEISVVIKKFREFTKDCVLVAHNANFDVSFIKKSYGEYGITFDNPVMDTIPLCKFLYPELKKYKLDTVCKHLGISLENHHRAVDDAGATAEIVLNSFILLKEKNIIELKTLNKEFLKNQDIRKAPAYHLIILVKNQVGLKNLYKLVSFSNLNYFYRKPRMPKSLIQKYREGLIIGSACEAGQFYKAVLNGKSDDELNQMIKFYDYLEIQPIQNNEFMIRKGIVKSEDELREINRKIFELGLKNNKLTVATGDVHFLDKSDAVFRKILMAGQGFSDADNQPPLYLKTTNEMLEEFSYLGKENAKKVVVENPQKIVDLIEKVKPIPDETFPPKIEGAEDDIKNMTMKKVHIIYGDPLPQIVQNRLDKELGSIINNGYAVLYLIAQKLVAKSYSDGYLVGSRGSVGSSFVATMSNITEVNGLPPHYVCPKCKYSEFFTNGEIGSGADLPDKDCPKCGTKLKKDGHDIPFETFLGFNGDKEPDIDLNFSGDNQGDIHRYTEVLFGKGHTFKAGTIGTIAEKTAYGFVRKYLDEKNVIVSNAEIERLTLGCTGVKRTTGQHPGGIMVVPSDNEIYNFTPVQHPADDPNSDIITTHFDYHSISGRLLKLDILGHDDPTVLRMLQDLTGLDPKVIPLGDKKVMSLFTSTEGLGITTEQLGCEVGTYGLPEFGTKFVRQMLVDTQPKTFADLVRISGLSHGTDVWLNNAQYYIKEGYTTLRECIATRDDIMIYLLHKKLEPKDAFTIMEKVRKGKGLSEEHEALMREHNVPDWYIDSCKKIKYMFPKGHAVAYCMMAIRIAYYKVYYPKAYYATYFTVRATDFDANLIIKGENAIKSKMDELNLISKLSVKDKGLLTILELSYEMYKRNIKFLKIDIYKSDPIKFLIEGDNIRLPIKALSGVGENAAKSISEAKNKGPFISKEDLRNRAKVSKSVIEMLDSHGCLEGLPETNQVSLFNL